MINPEPLALTAVLLATLSLFCSVVGLVLYLAHRFSTHKIEYVTRESQAELRRSLGVPEGELPDVGEMDKLTRQFNTLYEKAGLGTPSWNAERQDKLDG